MSNRKLILAMLACLLVLVCTACGGGRDSAYGTEANARIMKKLAEIA